MSLGQALYAVGAIALASMIMEALPEFNQQYPALAMPRDDGLDQGSIRTVGAEQNVSNPYGWLMSDRRRLIGKVKGLMLLQRNRHVSMVRL